MCVRQSYSMCEYATEASDVYSTSFSFDDQYALATDDTAHALAVRTVPVTKRAQCIVTRFAVGPFISSDAATRVVEPDDGTRATRPARVSKAGVCTAQEETVTLDS